MTAEIQEVFQSGVMPKKWNLIYFYLLSKISTPEHMSDIGLISLCPVLYKKVSKILVKILKPFLQAIFSVNQYACVSNRKISNNIIIAHDAVHVLKVHPVISKELIAVKTEMSKAYDRLECYLRCLLEALGFNK